MNPEKRLITGFGFGLLFVLAFAIFLLFTFKTVVVSGPSMEPTLPNGKKVLVSSAYWLVGDIRDKDIVVISENHPRNPSGYIIKRVYALGGEKVNWRNVPDSWPLANGEYVVPKGEIYVLGDNREYSEDSRKFGSIPGSRILGKVIVRP
ncbi:MAG: signal peptidase I [Fimbriimonas sp.]